ncbi:MAG TPA: hypothetical protein VIK60_18265 [Vicinamibacterales bacterium]
MGRRTRLSGRLLTWVLALAFALVSSATCILNTQMTEAQKACCAAMNHDCGAMAVKQDCCATEVQSLTHFIAGAPAFQLAAPAPVVMDVAFSEPPLAAHFSASAAFDPSAPNPSSSPTYLLVSVFRL